MQLLKNINLKNLSLNKHKERLFTISENDLDEIKNQSAKEATEKAFILMMAIPTMVLHDHDWKDHKTDIPDFIDRCLELYDSYDKGYVSFNDLVNTLEGESGIKIVKGAC